MATVFTTGAGITTGDVVCQQFGPDSAPVESVENLGEGRLRLHHTDGATSRVQSGQRVRVRRGGQA